MTAITAEELKRGRRVNGGGGGSGSSVRSSGPGGGHRKSVRESAAVDQAGHPSQESDLATEDDEVTHHQSNIKVVVHVIWFIRVSFKRVFLPSTGLYKKLRVSSTGSERSKGLETMLQLQFSI